jgi:hypothetical protein
LEGTLAGDSETMETMEIMAITETIRTETTTTTTDSEIEAGTNHSMGTVTSVEDKDIWHEIAGSTTITAMETANLQTWQVTAKLRLHRLTSPKKLLRLRVTLCRTTTFSVRKAANQVVDMAYSMTSLMSLT